MTRDPTTFEEDCPLAPQGSHLRDVTYTIVCEFFDFLKTRMMQDIFDKKTYAYRAF